MNRSISLLIILLPGFLFFSKTSAQNKEMVETSELEFKITESIPATPVKNQYRTGTCWSFATLSFLESELLRMGKGQYDLSEMFVVRTSYTHKADKYVRMHGKTNFGEGGLAPDVLWVWKNQGIVPEEIYSGLEIGEENHIHGEMDAVLSGYVEQVIKNRNRKLTPVWKEGFEGILDAYLGEYPDEFTFMGKSYTPRGFADELAINPEDYVVIGSYTHHPFYEKFILEVPDNWIWAEIYNVPLDEMIQVLDHALDNGYSVCWDADSDEKGFDRETCIVQNYDKEEPGVEFEITQELRQTSFDNYLTIDTHLMHITGLAEDQDKNPFYVVKNSWGTDNLTYGGYFYVSKGYMAYKTIFFMVHKDGVPVGIAEKLGF